MNIPKYGMHPIRCGKTRCKWRGFEIDLIAIQTNEFAGIKVTKLTCPTCGNDNYMFMTTGEITAWNRKKREK